LYGSAWFGWFGVGFWVGLRARDFPTERVLSRTPLIIRTYFWIFAGKGRIWVFVWFGFGFGRFGVEFWVGLRAWDFPTERVLPRTPFN
jgi:hypothetical protein